MRWLAALFCVVSIAAADRFTVDWDRQQKETLDLYSDLLRIDSSNPPGNETRVVDFLKTVLDREGIPYQVYGLDPARANLVARLKGDGSQRPIILMGHTDVVGVQRDKWTVEPFTALRKDGFIYGRGAIDDKDKLTAALVTLLNLKRLGVPLHRDVIFIAEAGEESSTKFGIDYLVNEHWNDIAAEFAITEGGRAVARGGKVRWVEISTAEKVLRPLRIVARGPAGHGSRPRLDNPLLHLSAAVAKFSEWQPPMRLNDTTRAYFERLATISAPEDAYRYNHVSDPARSAEIQRWFAEHDPGSFSMMRTSIVPTILKAGFRANVIPSEAEATFDVRTLPDENLPQLWADVTRVINDPSIEVMPTKSPGRPVSPPSRMDTVLFQSFEAAQRRLYPGAITVPSLLTGATDMAQLRAKGVQAYGVGPIVDEHEPNGGGAHGDDERLRESSLHSLVQFLWYSVLGVAAGQA